MSTMRRRHHNEDIDQKYDDFAEPTYYKPQDVGILQPPPSLKHSNSSVDLILKNEVYGSNLVRASRWIISQALNTTLAIAFTVINIVLHTLYYPILQPLMIFLFSNTWLANKFKNVVKPWLFSLIGIPSSTVANIIFNTVSGSIYLIFKALAYLMSFISPIANRYSFVKFDQNAPHLSKTRNQQNDQPHQQEQRLFQPQNQQEHSSAPPMDDNVPHGADILQHAIHHTANLPGKIVPVLANPSNIAKLLHIKDHPPQPHPHTHHHRNSEDIHPQDLAEDHPLQPFHVKEKTVI